MQRILLLLLLCWLTLAGAAERPRIGLVLSGGGARGAAHVGVLKVLEELHVPIDYIAGTSMGAIIGGLYASGMSAEEIEKALAEVDWADVLRDDTRRTELSFRRKLEDRDFLIRSDIGYRDGQVQMPTGLLQGQKLLLLLKRLTRPVAGIGDFDNLPIPYRAVATDIATGHEVVIDHGDLALAMRASASIPSVFAAVEMGGRLLVDGGVSDNLPVKVARDMGADIIIAVDISTPLSKQEEITTAIAVADQLTTIMTRSNTERSLKLLGPKDLLLIPKLGTLGTADFVDSMKAVPIGEAEARRHRAALARLGVDPNQWRRWVSRHQAAKPVVSSHPVVAFLRIDNDSAIADEVLAARLGIQVGEPLDEEKLRRGIGRIYGMDIFKQVTYQLVQDGDQAGLVVKVRRKPWGPAYLDWGIKFYSTWDGGGLTFGVGYTHTELNALGGEYRLLLSVGELQSFLADFYQPLSVERPWFVNPRLALSRKRVGYYQNGDKVAEYHLVRAIVSLEAGKELGSWGEFRLGYRYGIDDIDLTIGSPDLDGDRHREGSFFTRLAVDTLDNLYFPTQGDEGHLEYRHYDEVLGGDETFDQLEGRWTHALTLDRNTLIFHAQATYSFDDNAPIYAHPVLGGFLQLSGYDRYELSGKHAAYGFVGVLRHLTSPASVVPLYLGATLEAGNVWQQDDDFGHDWITAGSLFLGADTYLGPLYLGLGLAEDDHQSVFLYLGAPF